MEDEYLLRLQVVAAEFTRDGALNVICGHNAKVTHLARWAIDSRLIWFAKTGLSQTGSGVARTHHHQSGFVKKRHRDLGRTGVVGTDVSNHRRVSDRSLGVGRLNLTVPVSLLRTGVIHRLKLNLKSIDHGAPLFNGHLDAIHNAGGLRVGTASLRKTADNFQLLVWRILNSKNGGGGEEKCCAGKRGNDGSGPADHDAE